MFNHRLSDILSTHPDAGPTLGVLLFSILIFSLAGCADSRTVNPPTKIFSTPTGAPKTASIPSPMSSPSSLEPPNRYPPPKDELPEPRTIVERAVRHLAGWIHTPVEEIQVVSVEAIDQMPPIANNSCASRWEFLDDGTTSDAKQGKLVTLQARGKNYRYYAVGEAFLLCPF